MTIEVACRFILFKQYPRRAEIRREIIMLVQGKAEWKEELIFLWQEAFGDAREDIELFFQYFFSPDRCWCYEYEGKPVSVIYGLEAELWGENGSKSKALYLYAGATNKKYRGQGFYSEVIRTAASTMRDPDVALLVPLSHLTSYYETLGLHVVVEEIDQQIEELLLVAQERNPYKAKQKNNVKTKPITPARYHFIREKRLGRSGFIEWDEKFLEYVIKNIQCSDGVACEMTYNKKEHILLGNIKEDQLSIIETTLSRQELDELLPFFVEMYGIYQVKIKGSLVMSSRKELVDVPFYMKIVLDE